MRAELSIVIPTLDAAEGLGRALPALAEGLQEGLADFEGDGMFGRNLLVVFDQRSRMTGR